MKAQPYPLDKLSQLWSHTQTLTTPTTDGRKSHRSTSLKRSSGVVAGVLDRLSALAVRWCAILVAVSPGGNPSEVGLVPVVSQLRHHARELRVRWLLSNLIPGVLVRFLWLPLVRVILPSMSDPKTEALVRVPVFAGCSREELEFLVTRTDEVDVQAGRTLIRQGKPGDTFYVL